MVDPRRAAPARFARAVPSRFADSGAAVAFDDDDRPSISLGGDHTTMLSIGIQPCAMTASSRLSKLYSCEICSFSASRRTIRPPVEDESGDRASPSAVSIT